MDSLGKAYYVYQMRRKINDFISNCATCRLNDNPIGSAEKDGAMMETEPNQTYVLDWWGPIYGFAQTASARPRFVLVATDMFSGFVIAHVASSNDDGEVMKGIFNIRRLLNGFPARVIADNAIFTPRSASLAFLKENNVEVTHGMAYISRCQSHAERMIGTLTRHQTPHRLTRDAICALSRRSVHHHK